MDSMAARAGIKNFIWYFDLSSQNLAAILDAGV